MIFIINEYSQDENCDSRFTDKVFPIFYNENEVISYVIDNSIYGVIEVYSNEDYEDYLLSDSDCLECDIPYPIEIFDTQIIMN